jgi:flagellin-like protein
MMMFRNLIRNKRALSPIFATLIILAVVTVLFVPVFMWSTGLSSQTEQSWQYSGKVASERIVIEVVDLKSDHCTIYVRNIGATSVSINDVIISNVDGSGTWHIFNKGQLTINPINPIVKGQLVTITISPLGFTLASTTYSIKVFTGLGVSDNYNIRIP